MYLDLQVISSNSIYIKANYNAVKGTRYSAQNLKRIFKRNLHTTYRPFYPLPPTPQPYYIYFCYQPSPITSYKLLQTSTNSQANQIACVQDPKASLALLLYTHHLLPIRAQPIYILFNSYKLPQTPINSYKLLSQLDT